MTIRARRPRQEGTACLGVEIDQHRVRAVTLRDAHVQAVYTGAGATWQAQLADVLNRAGSVSDIRVALAHPQAVHTAIVATSALRDREQAHAAAYRATGADTSSAHVSLLVHLGDLVPGTTRQAIAVALPASVVDEVHQALPGACVQVCSAAACARALDGATLALRDAHAQLTYTRNGRVELVRDLACGGLSTLEDQLGQGNTVGTTRLGALLIARAQDGPLADPIGWTTLEAYLRSVAHHCAATLRQWALPADVPVYVHGRGASAATLRDHLRSAGLTHREHDDTEAELSQLEPTHRRAGVGALLAARTYDPDRVAEVVDNPSLQAAATRAELVSRRRLRSRVLTATIGLLLLAVAAPAVQPGQDYLSATRQYRTAVTAAAARTGWSEEAVAAAVVNASGDALRTADALALLSHLPDATVSEIRTTTEGLQMTLRDTTLQAVLAAVGQSGVLADVAAADEQVRLTFPGGAS